jgi:hypothetical protein
LLHFYTYVAINQIPLLFLDWYYHSRAYVFGTLNYYLPGLHLGYVHEKFQSWAAVHMLTCPLDHLWKASIN